MFFVFFNVHFPSSLVAFLCGLLGSFISILALFVLWLVPAIAPQSPRRLVHQLLHQQRSTAPTLLLENKLTSIDHSASSIKAQQNLQETLPQQSPSPIRHVSFDFNRSSGANPGPHSLPGSPTFSPPIERRWSSAVPPLHTAKPTFMGLPNTPTVHNLPLRSIESATPVDELGLLSSSAIHTRRASTPLSQIRFSFGKKRRPSTVSTPTLVDERAPSPEPSSSIRQSFRPVYRTGFVNPFTKRSASGTRSPQRTLQSPETSSSNTCIPTSDVSPVSPPATASSLNRVPATGRRKLVAKLTSMFKHSTEDISRHLADDSPILPSKPIKPLRKSFRRKPVARTQPYGPPWNAPMPVPEGADARIISPRSLRETLALPSSPPRRSRERSGKRGSLQFLPGQLSPRTFINELDDRLSLLQQEQDQPSAPPPTK